MRRERNRPRIFRSFRRFSCRYRSPRSAPRSGRAAPGRTSWERNEKRLRNGSRLGVLSVSRLTALSRHVPLTPYPLLPTPFGRDTEWHGSEERSEKGTVNGRDHYVVDRSVPSRFLHFRHSVPECEGVE